LLRECHESFYLYCWVSRFFLSPVFAQATKSDEQIIKLPRIEVVAKRRSVLLAGPFTLTLGRKINLLMPYGA
jgi:hypothetical protein